MANTQDIQRRIKSIKNTKKVTGAMEVVSAAKMKKAVTAVLALRPYAQAAWKVLTNITKGFDAREHALLDVRPVKNVLMIVVSSNKGLCGSFNAQLFKRIREELDHPERLSRQRMPNGDAQDGTKDIAVDFVAVGKKGERALKFIGKDPIAAFPELNFEPDTEKIRPLAKMIVGDYTEKKYDKVLVAYTDYVNTLTQEQKFRQLLPVSQADIEKQIEEMDELAEEVGAPMQIPTVAEPNTEEVLTEILPRLIEGQILHAILESNASKESARMMAMKNATEAAGEIVEDLTLTFNKLRQAKITQEISEISAGVTALER